jgi:iron complex transport system substrate-binding protein
MPVRVPTLIAACALLSACGAESAAPPGDPARPVRVVPASATAVDLTAALLAPERIAGFPEQALEYSTLHDAGERFADHPQFYAWLAEPVLALEPDLVVVDPWGARDTNERLREAGVRVFELPEIGSWRDARAALLALAEVLGTEQRAAELVAGLDARVEQLRARAARRRERPRALCYSNFGSAGWSAGADTTVHEMMTLAGLDNVVASGGVQGHVGLTFEQLLLHDPDLILVSRPLVMGESHAGDRGGASERLLRSEAALAGLRAVRDDRIVSLPAWLYAAGSHEIVSGAELLADEVDALLARLEQRERGDG